MMDDKVCAHGYPGPAACGSGWCLMDACHTGPHTGQDFRCRCPAGSYRQSVTLRELRPEPSWRRSRQNTSVSIQVHVGWGGGGGAGGSSYISTPMFPVITPHQEQIDVTAVGDRYQRYVPGMHTCPEPGPVPGTGVVCGVCRATRRRELSGAVLLIPCGEVASWHAPPCPQYPRAGDDALAEAVRYARSRERTECIDCGMGDQWLNPAGRCPPCCVLADLQGRGQMAPPGFTEGGKPWPPARSLTPRAPVRALAQGALTGAIGAIVFSVIFVLVHWLFLLVH